VVLNSFKDLQASKFVFLCELSTRYFDSHVIWLRANDRDQIKSDAEATLQKKKQTRQFVQDKMQQRSVRAFQYQKSEKNRLVLPICQCGYPCLRLHQFQHSDSDEGHKEIVTSGLISHAKGQNSVISNIFRLICF